MTNYGCVKAIAAKLAALVDDQAVPIFAAVYGPSQLEDQINSYQRVYPRARVKQTFWKESDTILLGKTVITLEFEVEITTAPGLAADDPDPEQATDSLIAAVRNGLSGADLGDGSIPRLTRVLQGKYVTFGLGTKRIDHAVEPNERRVWFAGQCAYVAG